MGNEQSDHKTETEQEKLVDNQYKDAYQIQLNNPDNKYINDYFKVVRFNITLSAYLVRSGYFEMLNFLEKYGRTLDILCISNVSTNTWLYNKKNFESIDEYLQTLKPNNPRLDLGTY